MSTNSFYESAEFIIILHFLLHIPMLIVHFLLCFPMLILHFLLISQLGHPVVQKGKWKIYFKILLLQDPPRKSIFKRRKDGCRLVQKSVIFYRILENDTRFGIHVRV